MTRRLELVVIFVALAVRLGWALLVPDPLEFPDSGAYMSVAKNLAAGRGFAVDECWQFAVPREFWGRDYVAYYPPGYPLFLAVLGAVGLGSPRAIACTQAFVAVATVWFVMVLARRAFGIRAALASGLIAALEPHQVFFAGHVLTETLFTSLLTASLLFLVRSGDASAGKVSRAGLWGALAACAALVRVTHLLFLPFAAAVDITIAALKGDRCELRIKAGFHLIALGVFILALTPWTVRNAVRLGGFVPGTTQLGAALWDAFGPEADGGSNMTGVAWPQELRGLGEIERDRYMRREALRELGRRPLRAVTLAFCKLARLWSPVARAEGYTLPVYILVGAVSYMVLVGGAIAGVVLYRSRWRSWWPALAPAVYITAITCVFVGSVRFRVPAEAALCVLAGSAADALFDRLCASRGTGVGRAGPCQGAMRAFDSTCVEAKLQDAGDGHV